MSRPIISTGITHLKLYAAAKARLFETQSADDIRRLELRRFCMPRLCCKNESADLLVQPATAGLKRRLAERRRDLLGQRAVYEEIADPVAWPA